MMYQNNLKLCFIFILIILSAQSSALFEDQVGKFDWRAQHFGCPVQHLFGRSKSGLDSLIVATDQNVFGSVNSNSGDIEWRQLNEHPTSTVPSFVASDDEILGIVNSGEYLRLFDRSTGALKWQVRTEAKDLKMTDVLIHEGKRIVRAKDKLMAFGDSQTHIWSVDVKSHTEIYGIMSAGKSQIVVASKNEDGNLCLQYYSSLDGAQIKTSVQSAVNQCSISQNSIVCIGKSGNVLSVVTKETDNVKIGATNLPDAASSSSLKTLPCTNTFAIETSGGNVHVVKASESGPKLLLKAKAGSAYSCATSSDDVETFVVFDSTSHDLRIYSLSKSTNQNVCKIPSENLAPVKQLSVLSSNDGNLLELFLIRADCRLDLLECRTSEKEARLEWSRFEGLASISSAEMIDLPLSDSQATIETEFDVHDASVLKSFILRVSGQMEQLRRSFFAISDNFVKSMNLLVSGKESIANVVRMLLGEEFVFEKKPRAASSYEETKIELNMERDVFNLHKLIIVSTLSGSVYGIHNQYGTIMWSSYLGPEFEPLKTQLGQSKVPLFILRTTTHYQYESQAAVAYRVKGTPNGKVVRFNPINGKVISSTNIPSLRRVELSPIMNSEMLFHIVTVDAADNIQFVPPLPKDAAFTKTIHLFELDPTSGVASGRTVNLKKLTLETQWTTKLDMNVDDRVVAVSGRKRNEKVHSQGKVLGDRSVLYKYSNPNLVAIASLNEKKVDLTITLLDAVTGQIVHIAKQDRASNPVHILHCENWVVYSYWNEKARRTELGIVELYEGLDQTNAQNFNSFTTVKHPVEVMQNTFVFPQGISAIAASDTEQGLTTRSIVIAMPFGGVLEVSKRILDARRPLDLTPELREEMVIPYMPEIPIATEDLINYNQTAHHVKGIHTAPSGLESTSLALIYGLDLFYTRLTPSGTFDVLKDDFDYVLISFVMLALIVASFVVKRLSRYQTLKQAWQ